LTKGFEEKGECAAHEDYEDGLNDQQRKSVVQGIIALPGSFRRRCDGARVERHGQRLSASCCVS